jgi:hypothetical protein
MAAGWTALSLFRANRSVRNHWDLREYYGLVSANREIDCEIPGSRNLRAVPPRSEWSSHFLRGEILLGQPFDPSKLEFKGEAMRIADRRGRLLSDYGGDPGFSVSQTVLAYHSFSGSRSQLVWLDRSGARTGFLLFRTFGLTLIFRWMATAPHSNLEIQQRCTPISGWWM